jgi:hypothetical protein
VLYKIVVAALAADEKRLERENEQNYYYFNTFLNADAAAVSETGINDFISEQASC